MSKTKAIDLTNGPILKSLAELSLPIMASAFLATAYNITDMAWIGLLGSKAVAGVGVGGMYLWLSQGLVTLARMGGQVNISQCCGRGERKEAVRYAEGSLQLTVLFGILFAAVCLFFLKPLINFFHLQDAQTYAYAKNYMWITCGLIIFSFLTYTLTGIYTAQGDSKTPFIANLAGLVVNMIFDPLLILGVGPFPRLEVTGAAIATVGAQILVFAVMLAKALHADPETNVLRSVHIFSKLPGRYYKSIFEIGIPAALQSSVYCIISMVLTRMVAAFGPGAVAVQRVGGQIESVSWNTADGFAAALNAFIGQNYGAGKKERIHKGYNVSLRLLAAWGLLISVLFILIPRPISSLFFHEADVIEIAVGYLTVLGFGETFMCIEIMTIGALSGLGKTKICSIISIIVTGARIPLALLFTSMGMGVTGIWWALTVTSTAKGIIFYFTFKHISRRL